MVIHTLIHIISPPHPTPFQTISTPHPTPSCSTYWSGTTTTFRCSVVTYNLTISPPQPTLFHTISTPHSRLSHPTPNPIMQYLYVVYLLERHYHYISRSSGHAALRLLIGTSLGYIAFTTSLHNVYDISIDTSLSADEVYSSVKVCEFTHFIPPVKDPGSLFFILEKNGMYFSKSILHSQTIYTKILT